MRKVIPVLIITTLIIIFSNAIETQATPISNLKGSNELSVLIEDINKEGQKAGIKEEELKAFVELMLRQNGIRVLDNALPWLYVNTNIVVKGDSLLIFNIAIDVIDRVVIQRNKTEGFASIWSQSTVALTTPVGLKITSRKISRYF